MSTFRRWLRGQRERNDPISDLACDIAADRGLVRPNQSLSDLYHWLRLQGATAEALETLINAYREWQAAGNTYRATRDRPQLRQSLSPRLRFKIFKRDNYRCQICGRSAQDGVVLEVDHKVPVSKGGSHTPENLWTLCFTCNRGKRDDNL